MDRQCVRKGCVRSKRIEIEHGYCSLCCGLVEYVRDWLTDCISDREHNKQNINALLFVLLWIALLVEQTEQVMDSVSRHVKKD